MIQEYKKGDVIRIKSHDEILNTLVCDRSCGGIYYSENRKKYTGKTVSITAVFKADNGKIMYKVNGNDYLWLHEWLSPIKKTGDYLNDGSIEERSLCLALIRQTMSGNEPNLRIFTPHTACNGKSTGGFTYDDFPEDGWSYTIAKNIPEWPCLNLKPEILEEAIRNCLSQHDLQVFKGSVNYNIGCWFLFDKTEKSDLWFEVARVLRAIHLETVKDTDIEQPYKTKENEIKFQRKKASVLRGTVPEGSQQSSGKCKTATCSGHLSYQVCTGR